MKQATSRGSATQGKGARRGRRREAVVRAARAGDLSAVVAIDEEATGLRKPAYWKERLSWTGRGRRDRFFLVADHEGEVAGFILGDVRAWEFGSPPSGWIFGIDVRRKARLRGIGTLLHQAICQRFRAAGVEMVRTMPSKHANLVMSFFRGQGFMAGPFVLLEKRIGT
ncbi:MAG TPA: GNAT family N-acetyltransferase [Myxococcales bacterium]|nr:GNAT family N-acetyltransferase [Myxococcales bacterium]